MKFKLTLWEVYGPEGEEFSIEGMVTHLTDRIGDLEFDNRIAVNLLERSKAEIAELKERSKVVYDEACEAGYERGKRDHAIYFRCAGCGEPCLVKPNGTVHRFINDVLIENGWGHTSCVN